MRGQLRERFEEVEIVGEFAPSVSLPSRPWRPHAPCPEIFAQAHRPVRRLRRSARQGWRARRRARRRIGNVLLGIDEGFGHARGSTSARRGASRRAARGPLPWRSRLGAALRLERQVDILEPRLGVGVQNAAPAPHQLALLADRIRGSPCGAPRARADSAAAPRACAVACRRAAGRFLAIARDEGNGRATVEQRMAASTCSLPDPKLLRNLLVNFCHAITPLLNFISLLGKPTRLRGRRLWTNRG